MRVDRAKFAAELAKADLNVKILAERSGVSRATITAIRSGKSCSNETAGKLAAGLGVSIEEIMQKEVKP